MALVEVNQVQVTFGEKTAVSAASFTIAKGETFSLIGESGCGKSTLLRVLAGLQREWRGNITLLGETLTPGRRFQGTLRRNVQMVFQDPWASLHPNHTIARTLSEPLYIHGETQIAEKMADALKQVGLSADAGKRYPHQLSGGQRQRVALARCLVREQPILLLDEPFSALDPALRQEMLTLVQDVCQCQQLTMLMVSHSIEDAARIAPRSVVIAEGRIVWDGMTEELLKGNAAASSLLGISAV